MTTDRQTDLEWLAEHFWVPCIFPHEGHDGYAALRSAAEAS